MSGSPPINTTFQAMLEALELTPAQRARAESQQRVVRQVLATELELDPARPTFLTGSFARGTAIRRLKDIDLFAVRQASPLAAPPREAPEVALGPVHGALRRAYPDAVEPVPQDHTVRITFRSHDPREQISFEVVPAVHRAGGGYWIPEKASRGWIASDPARHAAVTEAANNRTSGRAGRLTKVAKAFAKGSGRDVKIASFHLEMMVCEWATSAAGEFAPTVRSLFAHLAERVTQPFPDPAGIGPAIDARLTDADRSRLRARFLDAAREADDALMLAQRDVDGAHWIWRKLLGDRYPVIGRKPATGTEQRARAIDDTGSRFG